MIIAAPASVLGVALRSDASPPSPALSTKSDMQSVACEIEAQDQQCTLHTLTQAMFVEQLDTPFQFRQSRSAIPAEFTLTQVYDYKTRLRHARTAALTDESFSLVFHASEDVIDPQSIYTITHESLGTFNLFLVQSTSDGKTFEAIINRLQA